jgi:hypothetical protein
MAGGPGQVGFLEIEFDRPFHNGFTLEKLGGKVVMAFLWLQALGGRTLVLDGPCDRQKKGAVFKGLDVVRDVAIQGEKASRRKIERTTRRAHLNVASETVDAKPAVGLMLRDPCARFERGQDDAKIVVLHERPGVLTALPLRLTLELLDFSVEVEFEERGSHRLLVRSAVLRMLVQAISHDFLRLNRLACK